MYSCADEEMHQGEFERVEKRFAIAVSIIAICGYVHGYVI